jgi:hypothetical protein
MRPRSATTVAPGRGPAPVPSIRVTPVIANDGDCANATALAVTTAPRIDTR